jgi:hypothetical protein
MLEGFEFAWFFFCFVLFVCCFCFNSNYRILFSTYVHVLCLVAEKPEEQKRRENKIKILYFLSPRKGELSAAQL